MLYFCILFLFCEQLNDVYNMFLFVASMIQSVKNNIQLGWRLAVFLVIKINTHRRQINILNDKVI